MSFSFLPGKAYTQMKRAAIGLRSKMLLGLLLAAGLLTLVGAEEPAKAAFPGQNGKTAFTSNRVTAANPTGDYEIFTMNPDGTSFAQLTFNTQGDYAPAWSADGKQIAFTRYQDGNSEIYKMKPKPEGRRNRPVNLSRSPTEDDQPKWSADGKQIAFATRRGVGSDLEAARIGE